MPLDSSNLILRLTEFFPPENTTPWSGGKTYRSFHFSLAWNTWDLYFPLCRCNGAEVVFVKPNVIIWPEWICSSRKPFGSLLTLGAGWEAFLILSKPDYRLHTGRPAHQLLGDSIELYWLPQLSSPAPPPGDLFLSQIVSWVLRRSLLQNRHLKKCMLSVRKIYWERNWKRWMLCVKKKYFKETQEMHAGCQIACVHIKAQLHQ